jgi:2-keto-4-pentenoate hydratase/2-oxohepta-3-ene-1,7-dioic acid hydratase in catechol pathway
MRVIGQPARHVVPADALAHVAGYTVVNDITVRDWQHRTREFLAGKTFESTTPLGPALVTPGANLWSPRSRTTSHHSYRGHRRTPQCSHR